MLADLGRQIVWPTDIATFDRDAMVVRDTTHMSSPLSINREKAGFRPPVLHSSLGHAYLAFCPDAEREMILRNIAASDRPDATYDGGRGRNQPGDRGPESGFLSERYFPIGCYFRQLGAQTFARCPAL